MREIKAIIRPERLLDVVDALRRIPNMPGVTVSAVQGFARGATSSLDLPAPVGQAQFTKVEAVVPFAMTTRVIEAIRGAAHTGRPGDGKIFVLPVDIVTRISTGEEGEEAI